MGFFSRNILPKIKDGAYVINLDEYESIGTHLIALYVDDNNVTYLALELNMFQKNPKIFIENQNITNIYRIP